MSKYAKTILVPISIAALLSCCSGCSGTTATAGKKIKVVIGNWPPESKTTERQEKTRHLNEMNKKYPDVEFVPETWSATPENFLIKASSNQLPTVYPVFFTEVKKIISAGYAADITDNLKKYEDSFFMNDVTKNLVSDNGRIYGIPGSEYCMALYANLDVFGEAGLLNADGTVKFPDTYDGLAETAALIKERTGKAGFVIPTASNSGGWNFMNIAWSFGAEFMRKNSDGGWVACFDSDEAVSALQYVKDLKWKYNALPDKTYIDSHEYLRMYADGEAAMMFGAQTISDLVSVNHIDINKISLGKMPKGPKGRFSLLGGSVTMISPSANKEQIDAALLWVFDEQGSGGADLEKKLRARYESTRNNGYIIGVKAPAEHGKEYEKIRDKIVSEYVNVDLKHFANYNDGLDEMELKVEEPINAQGLYQVLDGCIRDVLEDENADCGTILKNACEYFQKTYLDDIDYNNYTD